MGRIRVIVLIHHRAGVMLAVAPVMMAVWVAMISLSILAPLVVPMVPVTGSVIVHRPVYVAAGAVLQVVQAFSLGPVEVTV